MRRYLLPLVALALILGVLFLVVDCGSGRETGSGGLHQPPTPGFAEGSSMAEIVSRGHLIVGVKYDVPLFGLLDPVSRRLDGFDVALAREIARALGLREDQVEFIEAISANRVPYLQEDRVDIIVSTMTITPLRREQIEFSRPYYKAGQSILVKADAPDIPSVDQLAGKRVCSAEGSTSEMNVRERVPGVQVVALPTYSACVQALKDNRVDAVTTDDIILAGFAAADRSLKLTGGRFTTENYAVGVKKGKTDLAAFISIVINDMIADGRWERLYNQYLGNVSGFPPATEAKMRLANGP